MRRGQKALDWVVEAPGVAREILSVEDARDHYVVTGRGPLSPIVAGAGPEPSESDLLAGHERSLERVRGPRLGSVHVQFANAKKEEERSAFLKEFGWVAARVERQSGGRVVAYESKAELARHQREFAAAARLLVLLNLEGKFDRAAFSEFVDAAVAAAKKDEEMPIPLVDTHTSQEDLVRFGVWSLTRSLERFPPTLWGRVHGKRWEIHGLPPLDGSGILPLLWFRLRADALATRLGHPRLRICARTRPTSRPCGRFFTVTRHGPERPQLWCSPKCSRQARNLEQYHATGADARRQRKRDSERASRRPRRDSRPR